MIYFVILFVLSLLCIVLWLWRLVMKRELLKLRRELNNTKKLSYNRQLTITLFDKDLKELVIQMNDNLDYQKGLKWKAKQSEKKLRQSISDIAHDLRTPLTVLKGNLQLLDKRGQLDFKEKEYVTLCLNKTEELRTMVDEFFEMSLLESDTKEVDIVRLDITKLLMQFVIDHETLIREHQLVPELVLPEYSVMIPANEQLLIRMLTNLLNNIIKYAKDTFRLSLEPSLYEGEKSWRINFTNTVLNEALETSHLFDRTYRGNEERHGGGAGLGLYIVKLLAQKQGAEVGAISKASELTIYINFKEYQQGKCDRPNRDTLLV